MVGSTLGIVLDIALIALLGVAIYYGVRLNRQIALIRSGREQLETLIKDFGTATERAEKALQSLKGDARDTLDQARQSALKAGELCDDLEFLIKRGEKVANALETGIRAGRATSRTADTSADAAEPERRPAKRNALSAAPEDRPEPVEAPLPARDRSAAKKARAKSKSELLKALQDMR
ncbi:MAG: hypothetical protein JJ878_04295 [Alphaproteobacteria bacterium]|nr:hypothetical protein [Alphaproteobacteria bacterium]MBO6861834.1 hypothetical protein [Alphaproteobacteria bacterium]